MRPYLLHQLLERSAERVGDRPAVIDGERSASYAELDGAAGRLAALLLDRGVLPGDRVALLIEKRLEAIVAIYAILKAGAAYVPLDASSPVRRLAYIIANAGIRTIVTSTACAATTTAVVAAVEGSIRDAIVVDGDTDGETGAVWTGAEAIRSMPSMPRTVPRMGNDLAYVLYTSGSTGEPKGVMLSHRNALSFVTWAAAEFTLSHDDRVSSHAPFHFDLSVFDVFATAIAGGAVALVPPAASVFPSEVRRFIEHNEISVWYSVPSVLTMLALRGGLEVGSLAALRTILFAGEVFPTRYLRSLMRLLPNARFYNLYGPTETNVCTFYPVPAQHDGSDRPIPIGRAIADVEVFALTSDGRVADAGEEGELLVRGPTVMRGYWGDEERTARSLVPDPRGTSGELVYRTGDVVRRRPDGDYEFLGRRDAQVKSRGYRIELGEIESALYAHAGVIECAVAAIPDELVGSRIAAFVVAGPGLTTDDLHAHCLARLPRYMVPERIAFTPELPRTSTGKVDRRGLVHAR